MERFCKNVVLKIVNVVGNGKYCSVVSAGLHRKSVRAEIDK